MPHAFPIPRKDIPALSPSLDEQSTCQKFMERMLQHTVREFEHHTYSNQGVVDRNRWRPQASHDELSVYRERESGATANRLAKVLRSSTARQPQLFSKTPAALAPTTLMITGVGHGRVENAMEAVVTQTQEELALVVTFMHDDVADCAIVHTMEEPTPDDPFRFLGYKYFVKKSPTDAWVVRHRHSMYLEATGTTKTSTGETLGFHLMHSVALPGFPDLADRHSIEAHQSIRYLYRQKNDKLVEVFALANMDLAGMLVKPLSNFFIVDTVVGVVRLLDLAEARRLTAMARDQRGESSSQRSAGVAIVPPSSDKCRVCHGSNKKKAALFGSSRVTKCQVCRQPVCSRCQANKRVFASNPDGILGTFRKISACMACVAIANGGRTRSYIQSRMSRVTPTSQRSASSKPPSKRGSRRIEEQVESTGPPLHHRVLAAALARKEQLKEAVQSKQSIQIRSASAPTPVSSLAKSPAAPSLAKSPPVTSDALPSSVPDQQAFLVRLQQLHEMAENAYSLTQQNEAAMRAQRSHK